METGDFGIFSVLGVDEFDLGWDTLVSELEDLENLDELLELGELNLLELEEYISRRMRSFRKRFIRPARFKGFRLTTTSFPDRIM